MFCFPKYMFVLANFYFYASIMTQPILSLFKVLDLALVSYKSELYSCLKILRYLLSQGWTRTSLSFPAEWFNDTSQIVLSHPQDRATLSFILNKCLLIDINRTFISGGRVHAMSQVLKYQWYMPLMLRETYFMQGLAILLDPRFKYFGINIDSFFQFRCWWYE